MSQQDRPVDATPPPILVFQHEGFEEDEGLCLRIKEY